MKSTWIRWLAGILFGVVIGRVSFGIVAPFLSPVLGAEPQWLAEDPTAFHYVIIAALVIQLVVAVASAVWLARISVMKRLIGWGLVILGAVLLLNIVSTLLFSGLDLGALINPGSREESDASTAFWFWLLAMALPYTVIGAAGLIVGGILLRKARGESGSGRKKGRPA
ncbi:MAG: hypothetical protein RLN92_02060 [Alloalcanivorax xenomutans]|jgi:hypothetical protein